MPDYKIKSESDQPLSHKKSVAVIIVAAGRGHRASKDLPKQYQLVFNKSVINHTIKSFYSCNTINNILCVIHPDDHMLYYEAIKPYTILAPVHGGATRQESVYNGLLALQGLAPDIVLIHDAARPFISKRTIDELIETITQGEKAALPAQPIVDSLKKASGDYVTSTPDREGLYRAQTPQAFGYTEILKAHQAVIGQELTDDVAVAMAAGYSAKVIAGSETAFKITHAHDFKKAEDYLMMQMNDIRVGQGYDVHRFEAGDHVWLCGVKIPHTMALKGHSDADVAMHALTDALYGALAEGDIGRHFPPSDPQWKGAASEMFLKHASDLVAAKNGTIANIDITIICEAPKISPHADAMMQKLSDIMSMDIARISVKATTTEKLGFTGRGEGIAAVAIATIRLPLGDIS